MSSRSEEGAPTRILCVILHYGSEPDTWRCVASIAEEPQLDIVVSDNDPAQSLEVPGVFEERVSVVRTGGAAGFAEGNNIAVAASLQAAHAHILLLNNDTVVEAGAITKLRDALQAPSVGVVGPLMPFLDAPDRVWACGGRIVRWRAQIHGFKEAPEHDAPLDVDYLPGAAIMCRAELWRRLGGLSDRYFLAYEEAEFAIEARRLGLAVRVVPGARVLHAVGMSGSVAPMYLYNQVRNRIRFARFLFGPLLGDLVGLINVLDVLRARSVGRALNRMRLLLRALADEYAGHRLDRAALLSVPGDLRV